MNKLSSVFFTVTELISIFSILRFILLPLMPNQASLFYYSSTITDNILPIFMVFVLELLNVVSQAWLFKPDNFTPEWSIKSEKMVLSLLVMGGLYTMLLFTGRYRLLILSSLTLFISRVFKAIGSPQVNTSTLIPLVLFMFCGIIATIMSFILPNIINVYSLGGQSDILLFPPFGAVVLYFLLRAVGSVTSEVILLVK